MSFNKYKITTFSFFSKNIHLYTILYLWFKYKYFLLSFQNIINWFNFNNFKCFELFLQSPFQLSFTVLVHYRFLIYIQLLIKYTTIIYITLSSNMTLSFFLIDSFPSVKGTSSTTLLSIYRRLTFYAMNFHPIY